MFKTSEEFILAIVTSLIQDPSTDHDDECNPLFAYGRYFYRDYLRNEESVRDGFSISLTPTEHFRMLILERVLSSVALGLVGG